MSLSGIIFIILSSSLSSLVAETLGDHVRIVNGTDAKEGQYPYMVSLQQNGGHVCGGTIINQLWILTAAHCVARKFTPFNVIAGATDLTTNDKIRIPVYRTVIHPQYSEYENYHNDLAILQLTTALKFNEFIQSVKFPSDMQATSEGTPATITGWGFRYTGDGLVSKLQTVDVQVFSDRECLEAYPGRPHRSNICAGVPEGGKGQCSGDSGGPLLANGQQVGVVSWSLKPCATKGHPGVFTEVSYYIRWIHETIHRYE